MIVPLRQHRHLRIEGAKIAVEQVVFIIAAELREAMRNRGFLFRHDVAPDFPVRQLQFGRDRTIGVDVIAGMNEKIRAVFEYGAVGSHAAAGSVDAPALACGIARPDKRYRTFVCWRSPEMPDLGFSGYAGQSEIFKPHPVENILPGWKTVEEHLRRKIALGQ